MKKFSLVFTTALAATLLSGCGSPPTYYDDDDWDGSYVASRNTAVCVDPKTNKRVPDSQCQTQRASSGGGSNAFLWYYMGRNSTMPYYGERVGGGSWTRTAGATYFHAPAAVNTSRSQSINNHRAAVETAYRSGRSYTPPVTAGATKSGYSYSSSRSSVSRGGFGSSSSRFGGSYS